VTQLDNILGQNPHLRKGDRRPYGDARVWEDGARFCYQQLHDAGWRPVLSEEEWTEWLGDHFCIPEEETRLTAQGIRTWLLGGE